MLQQLTIHNFTIIDSLDLDFNSGLTVLTGETGAGKSIIIDALALTLGNRASSQMVRHGQKRADISATFDISAINDAQSFLKNLELDNDELQCIIRRVISYDGKSKSFINGTPVTLNILQQLSEYLINIHGQHAFQTLLNAPKQSYLLDEYAKLTDLRQILSEQFKAWQQSEIAWVNLKAQAKESANRADFLKFQIEELEKLDLQPNEIEALEQEQKTLSEADNILSAANQALTELSDNPSLQQALQSIDTIQHHHNSLKNAYEMINNAVIQADESILEIKSFINHLDPNPERLHELEERLSTIYMLARKHRIEPTELPRHYDTLQTEFHTLAHSDEKIQQLEKTTEKLKQTYLQTAQKLSEARKKAALTLNQAISAHLKRLNMQGGKFEVDFSEQPPTKTGIDNVRFLVSANPGQPLQPLSQVASGGELSRISLAIQVITAQNSNTPTLIFDEVDVGIGGGTAEIVGKLLKTLSQKTQVFCITHLGQVAAKGDQHLQVIKTTKADSTQTQLIYLNENQRIEEIARMIGGVKITEQTRAHAKEILGG